MSEDAIIVEQFHKLCELLESEETIRYVELIAEKDSNANILFVEGLLKKYKLIPKIDTWKQKKDPAKSDLYRNEGNKFYKQERYMDALENYNKSLCYAPPESGNVGLAYANRSAVYMGMGHHIRVVENIELARKHNYPKDKLDKLNEREEKCWELITNNAENERINENEKVIKEVLGPKIPRIVKAPCYIAYYLELKKNEEFGRYIVTKKDLEVGTVIAIEEPFSSRSIRSDRFKRCLNCSRKNLLHLIPCNFCCSAMFCSEECKKSAWEKFHQFECEVIDSLEEFYSNVWLLGARTFFESFNLFKNNPDALNDYLKSGENSKVTVFDFDFSDMGELNKKRALIQVIGGLEAHENEIGPVDLYVLYNISATLSNIFLSHTKLGQILNENNRAMFRRFIFKHLMIAKMNSHRLTAVSEKTTFFDSEFEDMGIGYYPFCSLFNHSCAPNIKPLNFRKKNYMIVSRPVKAGEQLFFSYGWNHFEHRFKERQEKLQKNYFFKCRCVACQLPENFPLIYDLKPQLQTLPHVIQPNDNLQQVRKKYEDCCRFIQQNYREHSPSHDILKTQQAALIFCMKCFFASNEH